jgi:hypothetical protein
MFVLDWTNALSLALGGALEPEPWMESFGVKV